MTYQRKRVEVDAFQVTAENQHGEGWPDWLREASEKPRDEVGAVYSKPTTAGDGVYFVLIRFPGWPCFFGLGTWFIRYSDGRLDAHSPEEFQALYEKVGVMPSYAVPEGVVFCDGVAVKVERADVQIPEGLLYDPQRAGGAK